MSVQVVGLGLCTVDFLFAVPQRPGFGQSMRASHYRRQGGGPVPTALVSLARLGVASRFVGVVGDDENGRFLREELGAEGVDTAGVRVRSGASTRLALVLVEEATGERGFVTFPETAAPLTPAEVGQEDLAGVRILHLDDAEEPSIRAARLAREAGAIVVFDGTWQHQDLEELLPLVDVPLVSEYFAQGWMPGASPRAVVERLQEYGGRLAVLTLGEAGCVVLDGAGYREYPAFEVETVDTTGAGDAFHGGFIYGLLQEWDTERTIGFASGVAALNCLHLGGRTGLPNYGQVEEFLAARSWG